MPSYDPDTFEQLFAQSDDPWGFRSRWYEERKRALTLACLPRPRFRSAFEPGCANGELAAALAPRCDRLLVSDGAAAAVALARERLGGLPQASVIQGWMPQDWPEGRFDLVVISELGYYLAPDALAGLVARVRASLDDAGVVVACHWRHPIAGCALDGDAVHAAIAAGLTLPRLAHHEEADLMIDVWSCDPRSVATHEQLV